MREVVKHGRFSFYKAEMEGLTFDEAKNKFKNVREDVLKGAWKKVNPKGAKKEVKKETPEDK